MVPNLLLILSRSVMADESIIVHKYVTAYHDNDIVCYETSCHQMTPNYDYRCEVCEYSNEKIQILC